MTKKGGLYRGLNALLPPDTQSGVKDIPINNIRQNPRQPRMLFDETALEELAISIREHGIIQPLIVSEMGEGLYELIAGERRWRASRKAQLTHVPVIIRETTPQELLELALIENVQRADLNPLEEAQAYQNLKDDFNLTDSEIAQRVGKNNRVTIANTRRLLNLPEPAREAILSNTISAGHGRALLKLETPEQQLAALAVLTTEDMSVRDAEHLSDIAKEYNGNIDYAIATLRQRRGSRSNKSQTKTDRKTAKQSPVALSDDDQQVTREMERILGAPVRLLRSDSKLQVTIEFYTDEQLQAFFDLIGNA
ncbi:MAG: ParB/RepB/Spo0J family partition protein [Chloroflexi bacterium AL-W]|nr:ParB/RepB/Spo0J family partition protein [Chloroflexi bacterium AL-N1]NOK68140.1 ParB/RepB/Spo0J family partition protein [Chloroflexi bacterium AL-N10]NOK73480.1 ParB/RepB/Spo0J family partition protein [Chloroflexi bacterium AL-N5]NOK83394.1 ParB/RepB/Spo0J family partition protein [Chloroflexi bacterium AL-W]NOK87811.1 ParB/RepB/Spo0J family partition protein [Chloroflexi bacterium AL-N15]